MLCEDKFFDGDNFREQLESAYDDFKSFTKAKKISHSQKMFTPRLVPKCNLNVFGRFDHQIKSLYGAPRD